MKPNTLAGLVVLAFVVAGVLWARGYRLVGPDLASPEGPALQQRQSPEPRGSEGSLEPRVFRPGNTAGTDATLPDITLRDATVDLGDVRVTLSVAPRPPVAFAQRFYRVQVQANGAVAQLAGGRISFEMKMPMGDHRYSLVPGADGWQEAVVVLPFCASGNPRWHAIVEGTVDGRPVVARFRVELTKPGFAPAP